MNAVPEPPEPPASERPASERPAVVVDALGRRCPLPIIDLARRIRDVEVGQLVELRADDPAAAADVAAWCRMRGHELVAAPTAAVFLIRRLS